MWRPSESATGWLVIVLTAIGMALSNLLMVFAVEYLVRFKFHTVQVAMDKFGVAAGILVLMALMFVFALVLTSLVHGLAPEAGGSGSAENKAWLNGFDTSKLFSPTILAVRFVAVIFSNTTGFPCGREGPTVALGGGMAFILCRCISAKHKEAREYLDMRAGAPGAVRMGCIVGGACGMAMIFNAPLGGILYMFEEVSSSSWPMELTFKSFVGCTICTTLSYSLLAVVHRGIREFVIFEMWYGPAVQDYRACDILPFIILSVLLGFLAPLHTMLCLKVQEMRKHLQSETVLRRFQPWAKMIDTVLFAILCAAAVGLASLSGECHEIPEQKLQQDLSYVQFQCEEGFFNPVASLLLTTPDGAVKMLFNRDNFEFLGLASAVSFLTYFTLNVLFTGVPVPTGNFTGAMLIGGMAGRLIGCVLGHLLPQMDFAPQGIYSMIGAAAMLSGFKQMTIAPVMFIVTAANNVDIAAPLMMAVSISLFISHMVACQDAWDEEQLIRKKLPYLPPEFCKELRHFSACDLMDELPAAACQLKPFALTSQIDEALMCCSAPWFPMLDGPRCVSLLPRSGLEKQRRKHLGTDSIHVGAVAQRTGIQILEGTSAASLYPLFAQAHLQLKLNWSLRRETALQTTVTLILSHPTGTLHKAGQLHWLRSRRSMYGASMHRVSTT
ncbi:unnamed protein product [Durusdinium trenchii]